MRFITDSYRRPNRRRKKCEDYDQPIIIFIF